MASIPGYELFNGATITRCIDGAGAEWIGMCAKRNGVLTFSVFKNGVSVPLSPVCNARGTIADDGTWIAWNNSEYFTGELPGFVPLPQAAAIALPPDGALAALFTGVYQAADFDTPAEIATRVQKQLDAIQELVELLKQAGVLV